MNKNLHPFSFWSLSNKSIQLIANYSHRSKSIATVTKTRGIDSFRFPILIDWLVSITIDYLRFPLRIKHIDALMFGKFVKNQISESPSLLFVLTKTVCIINVGAVRKSFSNWGKGKLVTTIPLVDHRIAHASLLLLITKYWNCCWKSCLTWQRKVRRFYKPLYGILLVLQTLVPAPLYYLQDFSATCPLVAS